MCSEQDLCNELYSLSSIKSNFYVEHTETEKGEEVRHVSWNEQDEILILFSRSSPGPWELKDICNKARFLLIVKYVAHYRDYGN